MPSGPCHDLIAGMRLVDGHCHSILAVGSDKARRVYRLRDRVPDPPLR